MSPKPQSLEDKMRDSPGVGMLDDGKLNVVTPEEHQRRAAERNAEEMLDMLDEGADQEPV